jgi:uncharacterized membrane protein HdeD (DUF308 family)
MTPDAAHGGQEFANAVPPPPRPIEYRDLDPSGWWVSVLGGIALAALGVWMLANPFRSVGVLAALVGASLIVSGVVEVLAQRGSPGVGWPAWVGGGLLVVAGVVVLAWPDITLWALAVLTGASLLIIGVCAVAIALAHRERTGWQAELALAVFSIVVGAAVLAWPDATLVILAVLIGVRALVVGVLAIVTGWQAHRLAA